MKFWMFHLMPWPHLPQDFEEKYDTAWVTCPNTLFDPQRGPEVYQRYINQLAYADQLGFDGVSSMNITRMPTESCPHPT